MKNTSLLLEYIEKHYDRLVEAYGKDLIDKLVIKFKEEASDLNIKNPTTNQPFTDDELKDLINDFDKLRGSAQNIEKDINKYKLKPLIRTVNQNKVIKSTSPFADMPDKIYDENGIKIFNGNRENVCKSFASDVPWCITRGAWINYRNDPKRGYPTFYLIRNTNLPDSDKLSFVAVQSREGDNWVYTNRNNNPYESRAMSWDTLLQEVPWLTQIPNLKSMLPHQPRTSEEESAEKYKDRPISYREWLEKPLFGPGSKYEYLIARARKSDLFSDKSLEKFAEDNLVQFPKILDKIVILTGETSIIPNDVLLKHINKYPKSNQNSILRNTFDDSVSNYEQILKSDEYSWDVKKILAKYNKFKLHPREKMYVTKDGNTIVLLTLGSDKLAIDLYEEADHFENIDINKNTATKYLSDYPDLDTIPFKVLLKLASKEAISKDLIRTVIERAKSDENSAMVVKELEDGSTLLIDTNAFEAYKVVNNNISTVPFTSEEVQNTLSGEQNNSGVIDNILEPFKNQSKIPDSISKSTILSLIKNLPAESRVFDSNNHRGIKGIILPAEDENSENVFTIIYLNKDLYNTPTEYGGRDEDWRRARNDWRLKGTPEYWQTKFNYFRANNITYNDTDLRQLFGQRESQGIQNFIAANPPLDPANTLRPIRYQDTTYLFNIANPRESFRISPTSGRLLTKAFTPRDIAAITGQEVPAARRGRQAAAAGAEAPAAAAPAAGEANANVVGYIEEYGLTAGVNALPATLRNRILTGQVVATDNGFQGRNRALGNRGRVVRIIANGASRMYIIRLASGTMIAQASFQPEARHYIITTNTAFNMGRVGNFIDTLTARNLTEDIKETLTRLALGVATKEELVELKSKHKSKPYKNVEITESYIIREFDENIDPIELKWHRDKEDRIVEIVGETDWKVQLENQLPISMNQPISIPKGEWHRVIKGTGKLTLKIIKEESTQYTFAGILITNTSSENGRPQKDILSDIRAIEGITIVTSKDYDLSGETTAFNNPNYYSIIKVKVDPNPYPTGFTSEDLQNMLKEIRAIKGVKNFKLNQAVEKTTV